MMTKPTTPPTTPPTIAPVLDFGVGVGVCDGDDVELAAVGVDVPLGFTFDILPLLCMMKPFPCSQHVSTVAFEVELRKGFSASQQKEPSEHGRTYCSV